jgi:hypothetical protein
VLIGSMEVNQKPHDISTRACYYTTRLLSAPPPPSVLGRNISEKVSHGFPCVRISCDCLRPCVATVWVR